MATTKPFKELSFYKVFQAHMLDRYQSNKQIAMRTGLSVRTVNNAMTFLRAHKFDIDAARNAHNLSSSNSQAKARAEKQASIGIAAE